MGMAVGEIARYVARRLNDPVRPVGFGNIGLAKGLGTDCKRVYFMNSIPDV
jgi:hypothetical protein